MSRYRIPVAVAVLTATFWTHQARADWQPDGNPIGVGPAPNNHAVVTADGTGGLIVAWRKGVNCCATVYAQRLSAGGDPLWGPSGVVVYASNNGSSTRAVVSDGQGGAIVFWTDYRTGVQRLRAQRLDAAGGIAWAAGGVAVSASADVQVNPKAIADGAGGAVIVWQEHPSIAPDSTDLLAQRIGPGGTLEWGAASVPVCVGLETLSVPALSDDGVGGSLVAWTDARSGNADVYLQRLDPDGTPLWTSNGEVACSAVGAQINPAVVGDAGGAVVAWEDPRLGLADIYAQRMNPNGAPMWTTDGVAVSAAANAQRSPVLVSDGGGAFIAWHDLRHSPSTLFYAQRLDPTGASLWGMNGNAVSDSAVRGTVVSMAKDGLGGVTLGWTSASGADDDIRAQKLSGNGAIVWPAGGVLICAASGDQGAQRAVVDGTGGAIFVWEDGRAGGQVDSSEVYAQRVRASGAVGPAPPPAWPANGAPVAAAAGSQQNPAIASSGVGGAIMAWEDFGGAVAHDASRRALGPGHAKIFSLGLDDQGLVAAGWSAEGVEVSTETGMQLEPGIAADDSGGAIVVWADDRNGNWDLYAQRVTATGEIASGWPEVGAPVCVAPGTQRNAAVVPDGEGGAFVLWQDERGADADVFAVRLTRAGTTSSGWPVNGLAVGAAAGDQRAPVAAADGAGGVIVAWQDERSENADVYAQRITGAGAIVAGWMSSGVSLCTASGDQLPSTIVPDGAGGAVVAWTDQRVDSTNVFAQRVLASGTTAWAADGIAVIAVDGRQRRPIAASDGVGGVIVAWEDGRPGGGGGFDLFAQRISRDGMVADGWPATGVPLCLAAGDQLAIQLVSDGQGGAIASWQDGRGAGIDIYATQITASGAIDPRWPADGSVLCDASGDQISPGIISDGSGGAIIGWTDGRLSTTDVYAMHIFGPSSGSPTSVGDRVSLPALWMTAAPNPSVGTVWFAFELPAAGRVRLDIVDVAGRRVRALLADRECPAGRTRVRWERNEATGARARSGVYFARLSVEFPLNGAREARHTATRRFVLVQ